MPKMTFKEGREEIERIEDVNAVLEWSISGLRELINGGQLRIELGNRRVAPESVIRVVNDLTSMIGANRLRMVQIDKMEIGEDV